MDFQKKFFRFSAFLSFSTIFSSLADLRSQRWYRSNLSSLLGRIPTFLPALPPHSEYQSMTPPIGSSHQQPHQKRHHLPLSYLTICRQPRELLQVSRLSQQLYVEIKKTKDEACIADMFSRGYVSLEILPQINYLQAFEFD
jgi:hypothetical protein